MYFLINTTLGLFFFFSILVKAEVDGLNMYFEYNHLQFVLVLERI